MGNNEQTPVPTAPYIWSETVLGPGPHMVATGRVHGVEEEDSRRAICGLAIPVDAHIEIRGAQLINCPECMRVIRGSL